MSESFQLMSLPAELRCLVYEEVTTSENARLELAAGTTGE